MSFGYILDSVSLDKITLFDWKERSGILNFAILNFAILTLRRLGYPNLMLTLAIDREKLHTLKKKRVISHVLFVSSLRSFISKTRDPGKHRCK